MQVVRDRERGVRVADRPGRVRDRRRRRPAFPLAPDAGRPVHRLSDAELRLPGGADRREVVGEVVGRARVAGAVDGRDLQVRDRRLRIEGLDRGVVPVRDRAHVDLRDHVAGEPQVGSRGHRQPGNVVVDSGAGERPRDLDAAVARGELIRGQRRVGGAEVDRAVRDRLDAAAGADRRVLDRVVERRAEGRCPDRDERRDERASRAVRVRSPTASRPRPSPTAAQPATAPRRASPPFLFMKCFSLSWGLHGDPYQPAQPAAPRAC